MITPREMLRDYMTVLNILMQNPTAQFSDIVGKAVTLKHENSDDDDVIEENPAIQSTTPSTTAPQRKYTAADIEF